MEKTRHTVKEIKIEILETFKTKTKIRVHWDDIGLKDFILYEKDTLRIDPTADITYNGV